MQQFVIRQILSAYAAANDFKRQQMGFENRDRTIIPTHSLAHGSNWYRKCSRAAHRHMSITQRKVGRPQK
jgi:hypothetical protein